MNGFQQDRQMPDFKWFLYRFVILLCTAGLIIWVLPRETKFDYDFELNKPWKYGLLTAEYDFPIYKSDAEMKREHDSIMRMYTPYYSINEKSATDMFDAFRDKYRSSLKDIINEKNKTAIEKKLKEVYLEGIISTQTLNRLIADSVKQIYIVKGKTARRVAVSSLKTERDAYNEIVRQSGLPMEVMQKCSVNEFITENIVYDSRLSETARQDLLANISGAKGVVQVGQKIIDRGEIVDRNTYNILSSLKKESIKRHDTKAQINSVLAGQIIIVTFTMLSFMIFLDMYRKDYYRRKSHVLLLFSMFVFYAVLTSFVVKTYNPAYIYIIPYAMLPIVIRVFYDSRTAVMANITNILICSIVSSSPMEFIIMEFFAGAIGIFSLRELSQRSQLFNTAILIFLTYMIVTAGLDLLIGGEITSVSLFRYKYLAVSCIFLLIVYPLLFALEKVFGFTSNVTLVELSNVNNKLLRELSESTPGTFQHSMQIANLAAAAANRIGANSQLVRTGALYHDIGKMKNPTFFTENQNGVNPHSALSYEQSAQVVISHVTDGLKIAERYNLPEVIKDFIRTHHGTGKTKYFYISYKNEHPGEECDDSKFTYPGPDPFSKETAILMMADSVEAASRSLKEYTDENISKLVDNIVDSQVNEGFFKMCPITFLDIYNVKCVFKEKLKTMYHTRISYPELKTDAGRKQDRPKDSNINIFKRRRQVQ